MFISGLRKSIRKTISVVMAALLLLTSIVCGFTTLAGEAGEKFPISFENGQNPIAQVNNYYSKQDHFSAEGVSLLTGGSALNGESSLQIVVRPKNTYTETEKVTMAGLKDFSKKNFDKVTGVMLRLRLENDTKAKTHFFSVVLSQEGLTHSTFLAQDAVAYDTSGNALEVTSRALKMTLPAGFDGFLFLPLETACSETQTRKGTYDQYGTFADSMVDLSQSFALALRLDGSNWGDVQLVLDDITVYSGTDAAAHIKLLQSLGYNTTVQPGEEEKAGPYLTPATQPERYTFPILFEDGINPFVKMIDVDKDWNQVSHDNTIGIVGETKALIGSGSLEAWQLTAGCNRIDMNGAAMNGIDGFSKTEFNQTTGVMLRLKLTGGDKTATKYFTLSATQSGVARPTCLGKGAAGYDLTGKPIALTNCNLKSKNS